MFVKVPEQIVDGLGGDITPAMLVTANVLWRQANWTTGRVKYTSAWTLRHVTGNAYSVRTFSDALRRLELIGHITREMREPAQHNVADMSFPDWP